MHDRYRVSTKAILFNKDFSKVLVANYGNGLFGLPGGHIESNEMPDEAIRRELREELNLTGIELMHFDFDRHSDDKIVLFFLGTVDEGMTLTIDPNELDSADWVRVVEIINDKINIGSYAPFILRAQGMAER